MTGMPYVMRLAGFGVRAPKNPLLGYDVAGRVEAVGQEVTTFRPGDEVFGTCRGSFAEYATARPDRLASRPKNLNFEQAAPRRSPAMPPCRRSATTAKSRPGTGADHRCGRRRRDVRGTAGQDIRDSGHRCL